MWAQLRFPFIWADGEAPLPPRRTARLRLRPPPGFLRAVAMQTVIPLVRLWDSIGNDVDGTHTRKCSPFKRARTINVSKFTKRQRQAAHSRSFWDVDVEALRPKLRSECKDGPRPCPWIGCRFHMAINVDLERGSIKEIFPDFNILDDPSGDGLVLLEQQVGTCALDVFEKHDDGTGGVGGLIALYQAATSGKPLGQTPGMTIEEVAKAMSLSIERVRQLSSAAIQELRVKLRRLES